MVKFFLCAFFMLINLYGFCQDSYREAIRRGLRFQIQADSLRRLVDTQTASLPSVPESRRIAIMLSISNNDARAVEYQKQANEWFAQAERTLAISADNNNIVAEARTVEFAILSQSPYSTANPIPIDEPLPDGIVYKIQLGAFIRPLPANSFKGLSPISGEKLENGVIKYYAGFFKVYFDADEALMQVREYGFRDAFIVAFYNRRSISSERARQLE